MIEKIKNLDVKSFAKEMTERIKPKHYDIRKKKDDVKRKSKTIVKEEIKTFLKVFAAVTVAIVAIAVIVEANDNN